MRKLVPLLCSLLAVGATLALPSTAGADTRRSVSLQGNWADTGFLTLNYPLPPCQLADLNPITLNPLRGTCPGAGTLMDTFSGGNITGTIDNDCTFLAFATGATAGSCVDTLHVTIDGSGPGTFKALEHLKIAPDGTETIHWTVLGGTGTGPFDGITGQGEFNGIINLATYVSTGTMTGTVRF